MEILYDLYGDQKNAKKLQKYFYCENKTIVSWE